MKRFAALTAVLILLLSLAGCKKELSEYTAYNCFDTITTVKAAAPESEVRSITENTLSRLDSVFDIYKDTPGINGVHALNNANGEYLKVEPELMALITEARDIYEKAPRTDVTMGKLYALWHDFRDGAPLPDEESLTNAASHGGWENVDIDTENGTIRLKDPNMLLDLGAIAKGWSAKKLAEEFEKNGIDEYIISAGGNVVCSKREKPYSVGIQSPEDGYTAILNISGLSVVTSGGYQRYRDMDGTRYHHIIDPITLRPGDAGNKQVTVICEDSALADAMSTALFLMPMEDGKKLCADMGIDAVWVLDDDSVHMTDGAKRLVKE